MNTLGVATDASLMRDQKTPYVQTVWVQGTEKIPGTNGYWGPFDDVFHPSFKATVKKSLANCLDSANDPWCIGYFIENELSWGADTSLSMGTLVSPPTQVAKRVFMEDLQEKYQTIEKLNQVWGTKHDSWDAFLESQQRPDVNRARNDLLAFDKKIVETYFSTVYNEMKATAPNNMYLGCRLAWSNTNTVMQAAAKYCDVLSYNKYEYSVENFGLPAGIDEPVLIGEFHFGALDRGSLHIGIRGATSQGHRGQLYQSYVRGALRNPYIVGTHWFQYGDQPPTGRGDGENYNVGLLDICDRPFYELTASVREIGNTMYQYRLKIAQDRNAE